jgi:hydrogenase nickel incorporation protein HypA/HybF
MGIAIQILNLARGSMPPGEPLRIRAIHLRVGKLTAIVPQSLRFCMEVVTKDTPAEGARIVLNEVPVKVECEECRKESVIDEPPFACRECGSDKVEVTAGREMIVESIEVEELPAGEAEQAADRD